MSENGVSRRRILGAALAQGVGRVSAPLVMTGFVRPARASVGQLRAGPMRGHSTPRSAWFWLQTESACDLRLEYWDLQRPGQRLQTSVTRTHATESHCVHARLGTLSPGASYAVQPLIDGEVALEEPVVFQTEAAFPRAGQAADATLLAGSCARTHDPLFGESAPTDGRYGIFETMAREQADAMVWLGDNVYFRAGSGHLRAFDREGMDHRYRHTRALDALQPLLRGPRHLAIWDDHDYGPNNPGQEWIFKDTSLTLFKRYWCNASYGLPGLDGVFGVDRVSDVDLFLLDGRYYRDDQYLKGVPDKQMLGAGQMRWLQNSLLQSTARFKVICNGTSVLTNWVMQGEGWEYAPEGWRNYAAERAAFMRWLKTNDVRGVIFLSGDRHFTQLLRQERDGQYPLYEIVTSPLTAGPSRDLGNEPDNPLVVEGTLHARHNYCRMRVVGAAEERRLEVTVRGTQGEILWQRIITAAELGN
ncbi:MAG: alkaline phosphatase D family protein [Algiphilus sp.]|uniref:alkaline phosphatase D family protein n=2 Tax=Algiphilus sp. TaxID=1872431 RepID=UPI0032EE335A